MRVVGQTGDGVEVFDRVLEHGADPAVLAYRAGFVVTRPLRADRHPSGELVLTLEVQPAAGASGPASRRRGRDKRLVLGDTVPLPRQRVAAYAIVTSDRGLLCTEYSSRTAVSGRWGMPGGGIDEGEEPAAAVLREVVEETDQQVELGELIRVQTSHWVGRSPAGPVEDFHAVRLIYQAHCPAPTRPKVLDRGGTTASTRWVPLTSWSSLRWTQNWWTVLGDVLGTPAPSPQRRRRRNGRQSRRRPKPEA